MASGQPDYTSNVRVSGRTQVDDDIIVSAGLGFRSLDGRGRAIFVDAFRINLSAWQQQNNGAAALPALTTTANQSYVGGNGVVLLSNADGDDSTLLKTMYFKPSQYMGFEVGFNSGALSGYTMFGAVLGNIDGDSVECNLWYNPVTAEFSIGAFPGTDVIYTVENAIAGDLGWMRAKFVVDLVNNTYVRAVIGGVEVDLTSFAITPGSALTPGYLQMLITSIGFNAVNNDGVYIGYVIISADED